MNIFTSHYEFLKNEADLLLKSALRGDQLSVEQFHRLPQFESHSAPPSTNLEELQLKHAFHIIAIENGYGTWSELKSALDHAANNSSLAVVNDQFYPKGFTTYWNIWFAKYSQAKKVLLEGKGYLLPFKNQFFIVEEHFVDSIGLPHTLPEWDVIGHDWVHPDSVKAWLSLNELFESAIKSGRRNHL